MPGMDPIPATGIRVRIPDQRFYYRIEGDRLTVIRPDPVEGGGAAGDPAADRGGNCRRFRATLLHPHGRDGTPQGAVDPSVRTRLRFDIDRPFGAPRRPDGARPGDVPGRCACRSLPAAGAGGVHHHGAMTSLGPPLDEPLPGCARRFVGAAARSSGARSPSTDAIAAIDRRDGISSHPRGRWSGPFGKQ